LPTTAASSPQRVPEDVTLTRTIKGIEDVIGLDHGLKTLPVIGSTLSRNQGVVTLKEREPTPAAYGISTSIRPVWSTGED
jgi:hypothetical protein